MHILVVNDDGPPSDVAPYFLPFTDALQAFGHQVRVVIPDKPLSWIGKAHAFGKSLTLNQVCPASYTSTGKCQMTNCDEHSWWALDGSPASCTQIGLFHMEWSASEIDLVISGPNHGRNASTIYNLSSGTVGGAFEGALCGKRAISLSFGSKEIQPSDLIAAACLRAVNLIHLLCQRWNPEVEIYNVNIPMTDSVSTCPAHFAIPTPTYWTKGSLFAEIPKPKPSEKQSQDAQEREKKQKHFRWAPELSDIKAAVTLSRAGEDLWASANDLISITGFKANFAVAGQLSGSIEGDYSN